MHLVFENVFRCVLAISEATVIKAMVLLKPRLLGRILDDFWAHFFLMFNIGFSLSAHLGQYYIGAFHTMFLNIMTGRMNPSVNGLFWPICLGVTVNFVSCIIIVVKKIIIYQKEKNLVQQLNLNQNQNHQVVFNNVQYNKSLCKSPIFIGLTMTFFIVLAFRIVLGLFWFDLDDETSTYIILFFFLIKNLVIIKLIIPIIVLFNNQDMRTFMLNALKECFCRT